MNTRSDNVKTKIFLDSADPRETADIINRLGNLDGQTTNPTLLSKNPNVQARFDKAGRLSKFDLYKIYQKVAEEISKLVPQGSVSIEVYADNQTSAQTMLAEAIELNKWIPNAYIKFPVTSEGLKAATAVVQKGINVNITLVFSQAQAAAVYAATRGAKAGQVFISPFVGRLDDGGENGMDLVANIIKMYQAGDGHVQVLTASVRSLDHFMRALQLQTDIITAPAKILQQWAKKGKLLPREDFVYKSAGLRPIRFEKLDLNLSWDKYNINHNLTRVGLEKFASDWKSLIK